MVRPRLDNSLTRENVLSRMMPGKVYTAYALAAKFHVPTAQIRPVLEALTGAKAIELAPSAETRLGFLKPVGGVSEKAMQEAIAESEARTEIVCGIATPPTFVRLDGTLTGYDAEFRTRMALCMMARGR